CGDRAEGRAGEAGSSRRPWLAWRNPSSGAAPAPRPPRAREALAPVRLARRSAAGCRRDDGGAMATLTVWKFNTPDGDDAALRTVEDLQRQELIKVQDAAVVSWPPGKSKPKTHQLHSLKGVGALGGAFWGLLFGLIFFVPILGVAIGAATGALAGSLGD